MWKTFKIFCKNGKFHVAEHHRLPNHTIDWDSAQSLTYSTNYFQRLTLEIWFTNLEQIPLNRCQPIPAPYKRLIHDINITNEPNFTNGRDWPITTDLRHLSLTANNIAAKPTDQFTQTGLRTFDWQQLFLGSKDDFCSGCRNVSHRHQYSSGLHSSGRSDYTITRNSLLVTHGN